MPALRALTSVVNFAKYAGRVGRYFSHEANAAYIAAMAKSEQIGAVAIRRSPAKTNTAKFIRTTVPVFLKASAKAKVMLLIGDVSPYMATLKSIQKTTITAGAKTVNAITKRRF